MNDQPIEWPVGRPQAAPDQPLLPLAFQEHVELIKAGPAIDAFARKRASQILTHGHTPEADLERSIASITREAKDRLHAIIDYVRPQQMNVARERREIIIRKVEIAGAVLLALWDRLQVEVPEE